MNNNYSTIQSIDKKLNDDSITIDSNNNLKKKNNKSEATNSLIS